MERPINIITLGSSGVGKTSIIGRIEFKKFDDFTPATIGMKYSCIKRKYEKKNLIISLNFRDTMGHEDYQNIMPLQYIRDSHIVLLVFCSIDTLNDIIKRWYKFYKDNANIDNSRFILVGNKSDIFGDDRDKLIKQGEQFAEKTDALFLTCSAKSADNMDNLDRYITQEARRFIDLEGNEDILLNNRESIKLNDNKNKSNNNIENKKCC